MNKGIICFETGEFRKWGTKEEFYALPLLQFIEKAIDGVEFQYRQIVTEQELAYYINKIGEQRFKNKYGIVYFSFHGSPESIYLKGSGDITLERLVEMASSNDSFEGWDVHFGTCETFNCDEDAIRWFKKETKARTVSGYTQEVDSVSAYINELAYFDQLFRFSTPATVRKHMAEYGKQLDKLGFRIV